MTTRKIIGRPLQGQLAYTPILFPPILFQLMAGADGTAQQGQLAYAVAVLATALVDFVAALLLGLFGSWHTWLLVRNRTTMAPEDKRYDVGALANIRQVMGRDARLWLLPVLGAGSTVDGMHWPLNPTIQAAEREALAVDAGA